MNTFRQGPAGRVRVLSVLSCVVLLLVLPAGILAPHGANPAALTVPMRSAREDEEALYRALKKVEASTCRWTGEGYGEIYTAFSRSLAEASEPYRRLTASVRSERGERLAALYGEYGEAHAFLKAYLNDRAVLMRSSRLDTPTYSVRRNAWPLRLERTFPGLIGAIQEKAPDGEEYIPGEKALDYLFGALRKKVLSFGEAVSGPSHLRRKLRLAGAGETPHCPLEIRARTRREKQAGFLPAAPLFRPLSLPAERRPFRDASLPLRTRG